MFSSLSCHFAPSQLLLARYNWGLAGSGLHQYIRSIWTRGLKEQCNEVKTFFELAFQSHKFFSKSYRCIIVFFLKASGTSWVWSRRFLCYPDRDIEYGYVNFYSLIYETQVKLFSPPVIWEVRVLWIDENLLKFVLNFDLLQIKGSASNT